VLGATAAVDDGDTDTGARAGSHKLERLQPIPQGALPSRC
jgi:hypothetical protein